MGVDHPAGLTDGCNTAGMSVPKTLAAFLVSLAVGTLVGVFLFGAIRPSDAELRSAALDELGLSLLDSPLLDPILDEVTAEVTDRVVEETRTSMFVAIGGGVAVASAAVVGLLGLAERRANRGRTD